MVPRTHVKMGCAFSPSACLASIDIVPGIKLLRNPEGSTFHSFVFEPHRIRKWRQSIIPLEEPSIVEGHILVKIDRTNFSADSGDELGSEHIFHMLHTIVVLLLIRSIVAGKNKPEK